MSRRKPYHVRLSEEDRAWVLKNAPPDQETFADKVSWSIQASHKYKKIAKNLTSRINRDLSQEQNITEELIKDKRRVEKHNAQLQLALKQAESHKGFYRSLALTLTVLLLVLSVVFVAANS